MPSPHVRAFFTSSLLCVFGLAATLESSAAPVQGDEARPPATNVLLVTLEATRADRLGCYGYAGAHTPRIDALAARGLRFERAYTHAPLTLPAHASIHSGRTPLEHGLHDDARHALGPEPALLAEGFRAEGYRTAAFVGSIELRQEFGLARGFDLYDDDLGAPDDLKALKRKRPAREVARAAARWIRADEERPFFCWVQFGDARAPCDPPHDAKELSDDLYDASIAHMDASLSWLTEALEAVGADSNTLIVLVGSMGEGLAEHGEAQHGALVYESTLRVPLIVVAPDGGAQGAVTDTLVGHADLAPTLMKLLGLRALHGATGASFARVVRGEDDPLASVRQVYFESEYTALRFGWSALRGLVRGDWKFIRAPEPELYQLSEDPKESRNLAARQAEQLALLDAALKLRIASGRARADRALALPEVPALKRLCGIDTEPARGIWSGALPEGTGANPRERMPAVDGYQKALQAGYTGRPFAMAEPLELAVEASPDTASLRVMLAIALERSRRFEEAKTQLEFAIELDPQSATAYYYMARMEIQTGQPGAAEAYYQLAAELAPDSRRAQLAIATRMMQQQRFGDAVPYLERLCVLQPEQQSSWRQLISALRTDGRWPELAGATERAAERFPDELFFANYQAWVLATAPVPQVREPERALSIARELAERSSMQDPGIIDTLAAAMAASGDFEGARKTIAKGILIAHKHKIEPLLGDMRARLELYRAGRAYVELR